MALSTEQRAMIAAMELLRRAVDSNTQALVSAAANRNRTEDSFKQQADAVNDLLEWNQTRPPPDKAPEEPESEGGGFGRRRDTHKRVNIDREGTNVASVLNQVAGRFAAIIGPAAIMGQVLSSNVSGFQVLARAASLLATVIAPVLLPVTVLLATALVALTDVATATLMPAFEGLFAIIFSLGIPALIVFVDALKEGAEALQNLRGAADLKGDSIWKVAKSALLPALALPAATVAGPIGLALVAKLSDSEKQKDEAEGRRSTDTRAIVVNALRDTLTSLRNSIGPRAQIGQISEIGRGVQLAALNVDPIQARMERLTIQIVTLLERIALSAATTDRPSGVYGLVSGALGRVRDLVRPATAPAPVGARDAI